MPTCDGPAPTRPRRPLSSDLRVRPGGMVLCPPGAATPPDPTRDSDCRSTCREGAVLRSAPAAGGLPVGAPTSSDRLSGDRLSGERPAGELLPAGLVARGFPMDASPAGEWPPAGLLAGERPACGLSGGGLLASGSPAFGPSSRSGSAGGRWPRRRSRRRRRDGTGSDTGSPQHAYATSRMPPFTRPTARTTSQRISGSQRICGAQKTSGHHGARSVANARWLAASAPARSSRTRPLAASEDNVIPPR